MSRGPQTFRQRDLCAAIKAAKAAGCEVARIKVDRDGQITMELVTTDFTKQPASPLDEWLENHAH